MKLVNTSKYIKERFRTPDNTGSWFGYYNYDALNHDQTKMLSHRTLNDAQRIRKGMTVELGYYEVNTGKWVSFGTSDSYSWQQGSMLQWLPGEGNEDKVIYNTSNNNRLVSKIQNLKTGEVKDINWPIYCITPDGRKSIALEMERSYWCRAYHYESIANKQFDGRILEADGIFEIDLDTNTRKRIISIYDIINIDKEDYFDNAKHWLEHIMVSPNGKRLCFLHRFSIGELDNYETRLFIANIDGSNLQIVSGWRDYYWSHFGWRSDDSFAIYAYPNSIHRNVLTKMNSNILSRGERNTLLKMMRSALKTVRSFVPADVKNAIKKCLGEQTQSLYQFYEYSDGRFSLKDEYNNKLFDIDGHPSYTNDGRYMITDSYPDKRHFQRLIAYDVETNRAILLGTLFAGLEKKYGSCDLHPKLCKNNKYLVVDSAYNGQHHMILFELDWNKIKDYLK